MKQLLGILLILAVGLVTANRWFGKVSRAGGAGFLYLTGEQFLLLGLILGPSLLNVIDTRTLASLDPFVGLGLGYIGFVFGMQFSWRDLRAAPVHYYRGALGQAVLVAALCGVSLYLVLDAAVVRDLGAWPLALIGAATAVGTSTSFLFLLDRDTRLGRSEGFRFMRFCSVFEDLVGVLLFGVALCLLRVPAGGMEGAVLTALWLAVSLLVGSLAGGLLVLFSRMRLGENEVVLFLLGLILFTGGLATYLKLSPIFTNMVAGVLFANRVPDHRGVHDLLLRMEKPIYLFMLVLAGAMWQLEGGHLWIVVLVYVLARGAGKLLGGFLTPWWISGARPTLSESGLGLLAQSEMAVALAVNTLLLYRTPGASLVVSAVFVAVVVNDLLSSVFYAQSYRRV